MTGRTETRKPIRDRIKIKDRTEQLRGSVVVRLLLMNNAG